MSISSYLSYVPSSLLAARSMSYASDNLSKLFGKEKNPLSPVSDVVPVFANLAETFLLATDWQKAQTDNVFKLGSLACFTVANTISNLMTVQKYTETDKIPKSVNFDKLAWSLLAGNSFLLAGLVKTGLTTGLTKDLIKATAPVAVAAGLTAATMLAHVKVLPVNDKQRTLMEAASNLSWVPVFLNAKPAQAA